MGSNRAAAERIVDRVADYITDFIYSELVTAFETVLDEKDEGSDAAALNARAAELDWASDKFADADGDTAWFFEQLQKRLRKAKRAAAKSSKEST